MDFHYNNHIHSDNKSSKIHFLQFIMIFFAVILGFVAENARENFVNNKKEKVIAQSLYQDLKVDTSLIQQNLKEKAWIELKFDSVQNILESGNLYENNEFIYYVERYLSYNTIITSQDATFQDLKSSGNFKYIKKTDLYKKISNYYTLFKQYEDIYGTNSLGDKNELSQMESKLFNPRDLISLDNNKAINFYSLALRPVEKLKPIRRETEYLKILYIKVANAKKRTSDSRLLLVKLNDNALDILKDLQKEYILK
jgi:hypothetical protein